MPCVTPSSRRGVGAVLTARAALLACALVLAGCATKTTVAPPSAAAVVAPPSQANVPFDWNHTDAKMTQLFAIQLPVCEYDVGTDLDHKRPAFLCSGIIIRGATSGPTWNSWDVPPKDISGIEQGGVSFSWIRIDSTFADVSDSGYTLSPALGPFSDSSKTKLTVLCSFPLDAWTDYRNNKGCGYQPQAPSGDVCQRQGVMTADNWVGHYLNPPANVPYYYNQCGFDVATSAGQPGNKPNGDAFLMSILSRIQLSQVSAGWRQQVFGTRNEIRIANWDNSPAGQARLPIQSFYYKVNSPGGRTYAMQDQKRYFQKFGIRVPVVKIIPPTVNFIENPTYPAAAFQFLQDPADQSV